MSNALTHQPAEDILIYKTMNYSLFNMIAGNRGLDITKINNIIKEIENGNNQLKYYPILVKIVDSVMLILDGQNRFFIDQKLNEPVYYMIVTEAITMAEIARVNSNIGKWKLWDYILCYINDANLNYIKLKHFIDEYKINIGTCLKLLSSGNPGSEGSDTMLMNKFYKGEFQVLYYAEAIVFADKVNLFKSFPFYTDRAFIIALYRIIKANLVSIEQLAEAYLKYPDKLIKNSTQKQYVINLEQIMNINKQKRIIII